MRSQVAAALTGPEGPLDLAVVLWGDAAPLLVPWLVREAPPSIDAVDLAAALSAAPPDVLRSAALRDALAALRDVLRFAAGLDALSQKQQARRPAR